MFIAFISKVSLEKSFTDYKPISLCNIAYKMISKIIAMFLKDTLSKYIAPQQFGFLKNC